MSLKILALLTALSVSATAVAVSAEGAADSASAKADLMRPGGGAAGSVSLVQGRDGVLLKVEATGLTPGWHGIHFHAVGKCDDAKFQSAGGHVHDGAAAAVHGLLNKGGNDGGDLPNLYVGADGVGRAEFYSTYVRLGEGSGSNLLDGDGSAIVIHANPDDHASQPIGGAGDRVACGVIRAG